MKEGISSHHPLGPAYGGWRSCQACRRSNTTLLFRPTTAAVATKTTKAACIHNRACMDGSITVMDGLIIVYASCVAYTGEDWYSPLPHTHVLTGIYIAVRSVHRNTAGAA